MRLRYIYSACVVIETGDARILCDPWFTPGAYDGAWHQYPPLANALGAIGPCDIVYISHIHPDHYDPAFLRRYLAAYPDAKIVIGRLQPDYLGQKMRLDGFAPEIVETLRIGNTELLILPNDSGGVRKADIDTALAVRCGPYSIVDMNDNPFQAPQVARILAFCPGGRPDFALLPYSGAGPYPQTFAFADEASLLAAVARKEDEFVALFERYLAALNPVKAMPFAGKYYLGGKLARLNRFRGVPDAVEVARRHPERSIVLADGGRATYDLATGIASARRIEPYGHDAIEAHLGATCADALFDYEREIRLDPDHAFPFMPLLAAAKRRARGKVRPNDPYWIVLRPELLGSAFVMNVSDDDAPFPCDAKRPVEALSPRLEITIDDRYLFGLLTRLYHWDNAQIGSQYFSRRVPDTYRKDVYAFLDMFQV
jgi:UDP-MurNAc hydroxylase